MKTKKELKEEYKQMKIPMGVFQIKNIRNELKSRPIKRILPAIIKE